MTQLVYYRREVIGDCVLITPECWEAPTFAERERVFHQKFGPGTVLAIDRERLTVDFDKWGAKGVYPRFNGRQVLQPMSTHLADCTPLALSDTVS